MHVYEGDTTFDALQSLYEIKATVEGCWNRYQELIKMDTLGIQKIDDKVDYVMKILSGVSVTKALMILGGATQCIEIHSRQKTDPMKVNELNIALPPE